jgi:hypothetical protein
MYSADKFVILVRKPQNTQRMMTHFVSPPRSRSRVKEQRKSYSRLAKSPEERPKFSRVICSEQKSKPSKKQKAKDSRAELTKRETESKKKKGNKLEGELQINHQFSTQIKVMNFKKRK